MIPRLAATIKVGRYERTGARDEAGDYVYGFVSRDVEVYGIAPTGSDEPEERNRTAVVTGWDIYAPPGTRIDSRDRVRIPNVSGDCEVLGEPAVWEHNPYGSNMGRYGVVIKVRKVDG